MLERIRNSLIARVVAVTDRVERRARRVQLAAEESAALATHFPELPSRAHPEELAELRAEYAVAHREYVTHVSSAEAAISLEQSALLAYLVRAMKPRRALDTGSGFSSYVLRRELRGRTEAHVAVEDHEGWLVKTKDFLASHGLPTDEVRTWREFERAQDVGVFDLVFHDMGNMTTRLLALPRIASVVSSRGLLLLDDMHKAHYAKHVPVALGEGWRLSSAVGLTLDPLGRYAYVARRAP